MVHEIVRFTFFKKAHIRRIYPARIPARTINKIIHITKLRIKVYKKDFTPRQEDATSRVLQTFMKKSAEPMRTGMTSPVKRRTDLYPNYLMLPAHVHTLYTIF